MAIGKSNTRKVEPLEQILTSGDPATYGEVCWFLANRDTERHHAGSLIKLNVSEESGELGEKEYSLTEESINNIGRCLGMRNPEEALQLFKTPTEAEPIGECPNGHPEAAFQYFMFGIKPTEPCPNCGKIPSFGESVRSLNFGTRDPVKGTDGSVYHVCPQCGDDMIHLQGSNPIGWGWEITCSSCGWRIKQAEELDIQQYSKLMDEIELKVDAVLRLMEIPGIINKTRVESVCLQLRMILELIVFSSLVSNKDAWATSRDELHTAWNIKKIMKDLRGVHERFYPEPKGNTGEFLTKERLVTVYDQLNKIIHVENPLGAGVSLRHYVEQIPKWLDWIVCLLAEHKVFLYHHPNVCYWVRMFQGSEVRAQCTEIRTDADGKEICPWPDCVQEGNRRFCEYIGDAWQKCQLRPLEPDQTAGKKAAEAYDR